MIHTADTYEGGRLCPDVTTKPNGHDVDCVCPTCDPDLDLTACVGCGAPGTIPADATGLACWCGGCTREQLAAMRQERADSSRARACASGMHPRGSCYCTGSYTDTAD